MTNLRHPVSTFPQKKPITLITMRNNYRVHGTILVDSSKLELRISYLLGLAQERSWCLNVFLCTELVALLVVQDLWRNEFMLENYACCRTYLLPAISFLPLTKAHSSHGRKFRLPLSSQSQNKRFTYLEKPF